MKKIATILVLVIVGLAIIGVSGCPLPGDDEDPILGTNVIRGIARFSDKINHAGIQVIAISMNVTRETTTDAAGNFEITGLPNSGYIMMASYTGYFPTNTYIWAATGLEHQLPEDMILYPLSKHGAVQGHAFFIDRQNHEGIAVNIRTLAGQELPDLIAMTDANGYFSFESVPVDETAESTTYVFTAFALDNSLGYANDSVTGTVTNNATLTTDDLWLRPEANEAIIFADDDTPWESNALAEMLEILDIDYSIHPSTDMATLPLPIDKTVWIINDQIQSFYNNYAASQTRFDDFVEDGGTLLFEACDMGWNEGSLQNAGATLPGGVVSNLAYDNYNTNVNPTHPMMELVETQVDGLYGTYASHNYFTNLPANATILCTDQNDRVTLVEYKVGQGRVVATGQPLEYHWGFGENPRQIYPNMIFYTFDLPFEDVFTDDNPDMAARSFTNLDSSGAR
ncbi:MAG: carboxypeptidase-like regulatory domain-containing protein [Sphaerochaetaceae bacterium]